MSESVLEMILRLRKDGGGNLEKAADDLNDIAENSEDASDALTDVEEGFEGVGDAAEKSGKKGESALSKWAKDQGVKQKFEILGKVIDGVSKAFDLAASEAEKLGRTEVSANIAQMRDTFAGFTDTLVEVPIAGRDFLAWMGDAAAGATNAMKVVQALTIAVEKQTGALTAEEAANRAAALMVVELTDAQRAQIDATIAAAAATEDAKNQYDQLAVTEALAAKAADEARAAQEMATGVYGLAAQALEAANVPLFQKIELENQLAIAAGLTTQEELEQKEAIGFLTQQLTLGKIGIEEYKARIDDLALGTAAAKDIINDTAEAIRGIPDRDIYLNYHYQQYGSEPGGGAPVNIPPDNSNINFGGMQAEGGMYHVTEPTVFVAGDKDGETAIFIPDGAKNTKPAAAEMGGNSIVLQLSAMDEKTIVAIVQRQLAATGQAADTRRRI